MMNHGKMNSTGMTAQRWAQLMTQWGFGGNDATFAALKAAYSESGRYYHDRTHVSACLQWLDRCRTLMDYPREVELAIWFHDAVYQPFAPDNERQSAIWADEFLNRNGAGAKVRGRLEALILATEHRGGPDSTPGSTDESLLLDIDLAILGTSAEEYAAFETAVRLEYAQVSWPVYREKRIQVLESFLARPTLYSNEPFVSELSAWARCNLDWAIQRLSQAETEPVLRQ